MNKNNEKKELLSKLRKPVWQGVFYNPTKGTLNIEGVIEEIINYIKEKPDRFYDIIIGCDSSSAAFPDFPVAVVALRVGEGGRLFLKKIKYHNRRFFSWKERILEEVLISCEMALYFREKLQPLVGSQLFGHSTHRGHRPDVSCIHKNDKSFVDVRKSHQPGIIDCERRSDQTCTQ